MKGFSAEWLALREPYDLAARNALVRDAVANAFLGQAAISVVDLACGAGATLRPLQEVVDQLGAGVAHLHVKGFDLAREVVEHPDRRDGHEQSDSGGHQGF